MSRHVNIPIFIPHLGCPQACVFCNQKKISGVTSFRIDSVREEIELVLGGVSEKDTVEIAFFGGSFTCIERELMISLLEIGYSYIKAGKVSALRCSTRPDAITPEILTILKSYGMKTVEIGVQSMNDEVLLASRRGHTAQDTKKCFSLLREFGFSTVAQMMLGLPGSSLEDELQTAQEIIALGADAARIYPTVVFCESELCRMSQRGEYLPLSEEDAIERGSRVLRIFLDAGIPVIRIGLCAGENLSSPDSVFGGANHPALGELILGEVYYNKMKELLIEADPNRSEICFAVNRGAISLAIGHKKKNKKRLLEISSACKLRFIEDCLPEGELVSLR